MEKLVKISPHSKRADQYFSKTLKFFILPINIHEELIPMQTF